MPVQQLSRERLVDRLRLLAAQVEEGLAPAGLASWQESGDGFQVYVSTE